MTDVIFYGVFVASKIGKTGLTVTVDVDRIERATGTRTALVTAGNAVEGRNGFYLYPLSGADLQTYDYLTTFKTADGTVDQQHVHALWSSFPVAYAVELARLDATISSRLAAASYSAPPSAAAVADQVWEELTADHQAAGSTGKQLTDNGVVDDPLLHAVPGSYASGTAGAALGRIGSGEITTVSPVATDGDVELYQGDDYLAEDGRALSWTDLDGNWPNLAGGTVVLRVSGYADFAGSIVNGGGAQQGIQVELEAADTAAVAPGKYRMQIIAAQADGDVITLVEGYFTCKRKLSEVLPPN